MTTKGFLAVILALALSLDSSGQDKKGAKPEAPQDFAAERTALDQEFAKEALKVAGELVKAKALAEARSFIGIAGARTDEQKDEFAKVLEKCDAKAKAKWDKATEAKIKDFGRAISSKLTAIVKKYSKEDAKEIRRLDVEAEILFDLWEYVRALHWFNEMRRDHGVPEVGLNWEYSVGCWLHAKYLSFNPTDAWREEEGKKGFTEEGKTTGEKTFSWVEKSLVSLLEGFARSFHYRAFMLRPGLTRVGLANLVGTPVVGVVDLKRGIEEGNDKGVVLSPPDKAVDVATTGELEGDEPVPAGARPVGCPVMLSVWDPDERVVDVKAKLMEAGKEVPCFLSTPEAPAVAKTYPNNLNTICLIAKKPLKQNAQFTVVIEYTSKSAGAVKKQWTFKTGTK